MTSHHTVEEAFAQHRARVESVAARILRDRDEARDVASDTFLALLERGPADDGAIGAWLVTSARNRALNRARDRARHARRLRAAIERPEPLATPLGERHTAALVRDALHRLGARDRLALTLRFAEERSYDQVAVRLGTTTAQARVVVHRAAKRLRREAVALLAERHGAGDDCRRALTEHARTTHDGCRPCTAVIDEIASIGAPALAPAASLPLLARLSQRISAALADERLPKLPGASRVFEVLTALAITGSMGLGPIAPAAPTIAGAPVATVSDAAGRAHGVEAAADVDARALRRAPGEIASVGYDDPAEPDDDMDRTLRDKLKLLGIATTRAPVRLPDPLDATSREPVDIRRFEIGTAVDRAGAVVGVVFRLRLAEAPKEGAALGIAWSFGAGCTANLNVYVGQSSDRPLSGWCPGRGLLDFDDNSGSGRARLAVAGTTAQIVVPFAGLDGVLRDGIEPGTELTALRATTWGSGLIATSDTAPDDGEGVRYRIAR